MSASAASPLTETELISQFETLRTYLYSVARRILRHHEDAEDCVQVSLLKAWRGITGFRGQCALKTWLTTIVQNQALETVRKRKLESRCDGNTQTEFPSQVASNQASPESIAIAGLDLARFMTALNSLRPIYRAAILSVFDGQIAIQSQSFKTRRHRAIEQMRAALGFAKSSNCARHGSIGEFLNAMRAQ